MKKILIIVILIVAAVLIGTGIFFGLTADEDGKITLLKPENEEVVNLDEEIETSLSMDEETLEDRPIQILVRPVQPMYIEPKEVSIKFDTTDELINIVPVTQLQFKDGARVRNLDGATLTRTSLVLQMQGYLSHLKA